MKLIVNAPKKSLSKSFLKQRPLRSEINLFKSNLISLLDKIRIIEQESRNESEEHLKNNLRDFLLDTYYKDSNHINTKDKIDLVIHVGKNTSDDVGVIIETKRPSNFGEMISESNPNRKALHELILYYLEERNKHNNIQLKYLVATNIFEWYIFDANYFDKHIFRNPEIKKLYELKVNENKDNPFFYEAISKILVKDEFEFPCIYFDIRKYETVLRNDKTEDDKELIALYKIFSPQQLLKIPSANDANSLNQNFYKELLYIIGLEEVKDKGKHVIRRKEKDRQAGSLIENAINIMDVQDSLLRISDITSYGNNREEQKFNIALELCLTWINRILFLKLLEGLLLSYQKGNKDYTFLNIDKIQGYDELFKLFHQVLAVISSERRNDIKNKYSLVPYLNSSLFEISDLEREAICINSLDDSANIDLFNSTVLKDEKAKNTSLSPLEYLFKFLDSFDFSSEGGEDISEDNKSIITASVLGKVFEKINGYKDGSYFTPSFITMYMSRKALRLAVVQKFNEDFKENGLAEVKEFEELYNAVARMDIKKANEIINSLRICDPAVGSGHFLVSALNEMIIIKSELGILVDRNGKRLKDYEFTIDNDEIIISDEDGIYEYNYRNKESQRVQEAIFHEKQTIIENCLFGVDINPNSVKICRLRLWIELLKSSYYKNPAPIPNTLPKSPTPIPNTLNPIPNTLNPIPELETLPNIDINIKCGNSLISRFALDADLSKALKSVKYNIDAYRGFVAEYRNVKDREVKRGLQNIIDSIKSDFRTEISKYDPKLIRLEKATGELFNHLNQTSMFDMSEKQKKEFEGKKKKFEVEIEKLTKEIEEIKCNAIYKNAFEWRFEFPEVLNDNGDFVGFDVVIGNPPWGAELSMNEKEILKNIFKEIDSSTPNTFAYFIGLGFKNYKTVLSYILPDSILIKDYSKTRTLIKDFITEINWYDNIGVPEELRHFKNVGHDVCSIQVGNKKYSNVNYSISRYNKNNNKIGEEHFIQLKSNIILNEYDNSFNLIANDKDLIILKKINKHKKLNDFMQCHEGIHTGNIRGVLFHNSSLNDFCKPLFYGGGAGDKIENYLSKRSNWYVDYREELIDKSKGYYASLRDRRIFEYCKIYITRTGNPFKAFYDENNFASNNFFSLQHLDYRQNTSNFLKYILPFVISKVSQYFIRKFAAPRIGSTFVETKILHLLKFSVPILDDVNQQPFIDLVDIILAKKERNEDTTTEEAEIDRMVYELYGLTEEEIKVVEGVG